MGTKLYECGICSSLHHWEWAGDCREDANRYADEQDYAERNGLTRAECFAIEVTDWEERQEADSSTEAGRALTALLKDRTAAMPNGAVGYCLWCRKWIAAGSEAVSWTGQRPVYHRTCADECQAKIDKGRS